MRITAIGMTVLAITLLIASYASAESGTTGTVFTGEVWTWDERAGVVTLRQLDGTMLRVNVAPERLAGLRLHQTVTLRGELAPPAEIEQVVQPPLPMTPVPTGPEAESLVAGIVTRVDANGTISLASPGGPLRVWLATPVGNRFRPGEPVRVRTSVRAVQMIPAGTPSSGLAAPMAEPSGAVEREPGDYAVVIGRILKIGSAGSLTVESPRGPVEVQVHERVPHRVGDTVQVRTSIHRAQ
jgi:hypothetical protein